MNNVSTLTQKGQVAIPKTIREYFGLKTFDKIYFKIEKGHIVAQPVLNIKDMFGVVSSSKVLSKKEQKRIIKKHILRKHAHRS